MAELVGAVSLGIQVVETSVSILGFIREAILDAKHYGDQVVSLQASIKSEVARLNSFLSYLKSTSVDGNPKLMNLRPSSQSAVVCLIRELDTAFAAFQGYVNKHEIGALGAGHFKSAGEFSDATMAEQRLKNAKQTHEDAGVQRKLSWGLFERRKVVKLASDLRGWNDRLMNVLLCEVVFGNHAPQLGPTDASAGGIGVVDPTLSAGISLRALMETPDARSPTLPAIIDPLATLVGFDDDNRIATLRKPDPNGGGDLIDVRVFVETKPFELRRRATEPSEAVKARVEKLGRLLSHEKAKDAQFYSLQCIAIVRLPKPRTSYAFAFELPEGSFPPDKNPVSLLDAIRSRGPDRPTLEERFAMARSLVRSVFQLHSVDWLHKSIRSENVIFGYSRNESTSGLESRLCIDYGHPCLVGFEFSREERDTSTTEQDGRLERNIYRHPDRQGPPEDRFTALHDIYSLGVVLLEIGLWRLAINFEASYVTEDADTIRSSLLEHAQARLPHYMGVEYTEAVTACLAGSLLPVQALPWTSVGLTDSQRLDLNMALLNNVLNRISWRN